MRNKGYNMRVLDSREKLRELYQPTAKGFTIVEVPELRYIMVDGEGDPSGEQFAHLSRWLFAVVYPLRMLGRQVMGKNFVEPPLECLWWADDLNDLISGKSDQFKWRQMIVADADWITPERYDAAVNDASTRLGEVPFSIRMTNYSEGKCVQILHIGPPGSQTDVIAEMHNSFLPMNHLVPCGHHHEIYLNDARRVAPQKLRTVLRQQVIPKQVQ